MNILPPITTPALPLSAAEALIAPLTVSKTPPGTAVPVEEMKFAGEDSSQTSCDQSSPVEATQEMTDSADASGLKTTAVCQQALIADSAEASAGLPVHEEPPNAYLELQTSEGAATAKEERGLSLVAPEEFTIQEAEQIPADAKAVEEMGTAAEKSGPPGSQLHPPEDDGAKNVDEMTGETPKSLVDGLMNLCSGTIQNDVAAKNQNLDKKEPVILLSKGNSMCEARPLSTHHLSGWFIFLENQTTPPIFFFLSS